MCRPNWKSSIIADSPQSVLLYSSIEKAKNIYGRSEWVVMEVREFAFVEKQFTRQYSSLKPIT